MTNRELFHKTFDAVPVPEGLAERAAARAQPERRAPRRPLRTLAFAALIVALLSACAVAVFLGGKEDVVDLCNAELDELRALGLFHIQFEMTERDPAYSESYYKGTSKEKYAGVLTVYVSDADVRCYMEMDTDTKKISGMSICALPQKDWTGTPNPAAGFDTYDQFDAIIDADMTVGEYCEIWRQYQGCERYELPEGVSPETRLLDADTLDAWSFTLEGNGICIPFYRDGSDEPEPVWISYAATGTGPIIAFGSASLKG